jgi:hypothetical protein
MRRVRRDSEIAEIRLPPSARSCDGRGSGAMRGAAGAKIFSACSTISSSSAHKRGAGAACGGARFAQARAARHAAGSRDAGTNTLPWNR